MRQLSFTLFVVENPYIRRLNPAEIVVESGESVVLVYLVAVNSDGNQWSTTMTFSFTNMQGMTFPVLFTASDLNYPQHYSLVIGAVEESHAGTYRVSVLGEIELTEVVDLLSLKNYCTDQKCAVESEEVDIDCPSFVEVSTMVQVVCKCKIIFSSH